MKRNVDTEKLVGKRWGSDVDAAQLVGFSVSTLRHWRLHGIGPLPWYKVSGRVLYDLDEVEAAIRASRRGVVQSIVELTEARLEREAGTSRGRLAGIADGRFDREAGLIRGRLAGMSDGRRAPGNRPIGGDGTEGPL